MMQIFATGADAGRERTISRQARSEFHTEICQRAVQIRATGDFTRQERT